MWYIFLLILKGNIMQMPNYFFGLNGRIGRGQWWKAQLSMLLLLFVAFIVPMIFGKSRLTAGSPPDVAMNLFVVAFAVLVSIVVNVCTTVKRYHDRGKSGWWFLFQFVPIVGGLWQLIECGFCSGDEGDNEYGPPPGAGRRMASLKSEVSGMAGSSRVLAKLDDDYLANYAKNMATQQATQQMAATSSFGQNNNGRPAFGKR